MAGVLTSVASGASTVASYAQQAWDFAQNNPQTIQAAQQFASSIGWTTPQPAGGPAPGDAGQPAAGDGRIPATAPTAPASQPAAAAGPSAVEPIVVAQPPSQPPQPYATGALGRPAAGVDQITMLLQALMQRQIPPLPAPAPPSVASLPVAAPMRAQPDAFGLLRMILTNPQLQQALQSASATAAVPRTVALPVPSPAAPRYVRNVPIPIGAVMNAILALAGQSMTELNESVSEDEPDVPAYLVGEGGDFVVDPASDDDRAALVAHLFRLNDAARRSGRYPQLHRRPKAAPRQLDESDAWARTAGFL